MKARPCQPSDRTRPPPLLPTTGNGHTVIYACPYVIYHVQVEGSPYMWLCAPSKTLSASTRTRSGAVSKRSITHTHLANVGDRTSRSRYAQCIRQRKIRPSGYACRYTATSTNVTRKTFIVSLFSPLLGRPTRRPCSPCQPPDRLSLPASRPAPGSRAGDMRVRDASV